MHVAGRMCANAYACSSRRYLDSPPNLSSENFPVRVIISRAAYIYMFIRDSEFM